MPATVRAELAISPMTTDDWPAVRAIYADGIHAGNSTFEMTVPSWEEWDTAHLPFDRLVARFGTDVVGWAALRPVSPRECYRGVAEVSVYVAERMHRQGIGRALLREIIRISEENGIWTLQGSIFPENHASFKMCEACGFRQIGRRKHIAKLNGLWRDTIMVERRSTKVGLG